MCRRYIIEEACDHEKKVRFFCSPGTFCNQGIIEVRITVQHPCLFCIFRAQTYKPIASLEEAMKTHEDFIQFAERLRKQRHELVSSKPEGALTVLVFEGPMNDEDFARITLVTEKLELALRHKIHTLPVGEKNRFNYCENVSFKRSAQMITVLYNCVESAIINQRERELRPSREPLITKVAIENLAQGDRECPLCTQTTGEENSDIKELIKTPCNHIFCKVCIISWLNGLNKANCPMCRRKFSTEGWIFLEIEPETPPETPWWLKIILGDEATAG
ncbi:hypothetical protein G7Y89_g9047 [Cudoniella acicularis]|uniref:RING-type domain-containing protein n=1 Tax=Cudoniella acicularis TaxID=354080 RepID=A0A8H4RFF1_9HELO|nr:hypothetical protein G7Y89_g9047 [Cudoniella acicularis]